MSVTGISQTWGKCAQEFSMGTSEVQTFQMNKLQNNDVMNMNGGCTDGLNQQAADDDVMNMNGQSTDNLTDESHKMTSWMYQLMSQGNQVV